VTSAPPQIGAEFADQTPENCAVGCKTLVGRGLAAGPFVKCMSRPQSGGLIQCYSGRPLPYLGALIFRLETDFWGNRK
jgi:hypothetical protein